MPSESIRIFISFFEEETLKQAKPLPLNSPLILRIQVSTFGNFVIIDPREVIRHWKFEPAEMPIYGTMSMYFYTFNLLDTKSCFTSRGHKSGQINKLLKLI